MTESNLPLMPEQPAITHYQDQKQKIFVPAPDLSPPNQFFNPIIVSKSTPSGFGIYEPSKNNFKSTSEIETQTQNDFIIDLDQSINNSLTSKEMCEISSYSVSDELGNRHTMGELWSEFRTIFVFVRSLLCFTAKEYVEDLALIPRDSLRAGQIRLVVITCAHWKHLKGFRQLTKYPYLLFSDMDCSIYNKLGFSKTKDLGQPGDSPHVKSGNFGGIFFHSMRRALTSSAFLDYQGPLDQQGGSLIVGPGPYLHFSHIDKNGRDHFPINSLLNKVNVQGVNFPNPHNAKQF